MTFQENTRFSPLSDSREEEFRERLQFQIYSWIQKEIPSWQPERSPKYLRNSQALGAGLPGKEKSSAGLVYFKSVFDPCWSDEDLAKLEGSGYRWLLMILSPCERFYEFETRFNEIAAALRNFVLWRPDAPSRTEFENLHRLMFEPPAGDIGKEPSVYRMNRDAHQILEQLYITRGQMLAGSERWAIGTDIRDRSIGQYLSARLAAIAPKGRTPAVSIERAPVEIFTDAQALNWAELLTGRPEIRDGSTEHVRAQLIEWMDSVEDFFKKLPEFPIAFMTTRFSRDLNAIRASVQNLKPVLYSLRTSTFTLREAMAHIALNFGSDEERLLKWRRSLDDLGGFVRWMPSLLHAQDYLHAAFPLGQDKIDALRDLLLKFFDEPCQLLEAKARNDFDEGFLEYKKKYLDCYCSLHENSFRLNNENNEESRIDPVALRNLDLLSGLQYTDKIYLNRVNILAKWVQRNKCNLPVRRILERHSRCYCNFNPLGSRQPAEIGSRINRIIQEGIDYFRSILRNCEDLIVQELETQQADENTSRQIKMLLSHNPMSALKPPSIEMLNKIIWKRQSEFLTSIRSYPA
jgi:hypothetical protein